MVLSAYATLGNQQEDAVRTLVFESAAKALESERMVKTKQPHVQNIAARHLR